MRSIVIITSVVVAGTASVISGRFDSFSRVGGIIGTSISAAFLIILGAMNVYILYRLVSQLRRLISTHPDDEQPFQITGAGFIFNLLRRMFKLIDR